MRVRITFQTPRPEHYKNRLLHFQKWAAQALLHGSLLYLPKLRPAPGRLPYLSHTLYTLVPAGCAGYL